MADETEDSKLQGRILAGALLAHLAGNLSEKFDSFATWLLAGFGAALALLLTNHDAGALVSPPAIRCAAELFIAAVIVTVIEKYLAVIVAGGSEGAASSRTAFQAWVGERREQGLPVELSMTSFVAEFMRPIFRPAVWIASRSIRKITAGDLNAAVRPLVILSQTQGALLLIEIGLFVAAVWEIVARLPSAHK